MANPLEKIQALDAIEKEIILCIQSAGQALQELSKEKPSQKNAENNASQFLKSLNTVENKLSEQINYLIQVSTTSAHEGLLVFHILINSNLMFSYIRLPSI